MNRPPVQINEDDTGLASNYRQIFDENPAPMYIFDLHTFDFLAVNTACLIQYGYSNEEFLAMNATQIRPTEELEPFRLAIEDVHPCYSDFGQWKHIRKNGETFFVHIYAHSSTFQGRKARVVMSIDIDKRVKAENTLLEKNAEIEDILESITDGFYAMNDKWEVTYINKEAEKILCCKREDLLGKNLWDFFPRSREGKFYSEYKRALTDKVSVHFEECYAALDVWGSMHVYPKKDGLAIYFVDITAQRKIQERIFKDRQNLSAIINNTRDMIWSIDRDNNIISANDAFMERIEYIFGKRVTHITMEDFGEKLYNSWQEYFRRAFAGESYKIVWNEQIEGKDVFEEVSFNPILDNENHTIGISCFSRDITEQYMHTRMIEMQNEQLKKISWMHSHEVRGPLSSIMGLVQLFNKENRADPDNSDIIDMLNEAAKKLDAVVRRINEQAQ
jgi:PAS domain S-box-containing protein